MKKILIILLLLAGQNVLAGANQTKYSALKTDQIKNDTTTINGYLAKADNYFYYSNFNKGFLDSGYAFSNLALSLSTRIHNPVFQNRARGRVASFYNLSGDQPKAASIQKQIIQFYHQRHEPDNEADAWNQLADYYSDLNAIHDCCQQAGNIYKKAGRALDAIGELKLWGDHLYRVMRLDSSEHVLNEVIRQYQAIHYKKLQYTYDLLALISYSRGDLKSNLANRLEVIKYMEVSGDYSYADRYYYDLAYAYMLLHDYKQSILYAKKANAVDGHRSYMRVDLIVADMLSLKKPDEALAYLKSYTKNYPPAAPNKAFEERLVDSDLSKIYTQLKRYKEAEKLLLKILPSYKIYPNVNKDVSVRNTMMYVFQYETLANVFRLDGNLKQAKYYLDQIPENFSKDLRPQNLIGLELLRFKVDSALGNYVSSINHFELYKKLNDSVYNLNSIQSAKEIDVKYQTEKKEHAIKLLQSEHLLEKIQIQKAILQRNVTLAAIAITVILACLAYYAYRRKRLSNLLINKKNHQLQVLLTEKEWLLKEVHHRVKNNLHTVICLLESQAMYLENDALKAVENSRHRIYAMSLIHQKLYQSDDIKVIDMGIYLTDFLEYLKESFGSPDHVRVILFADDIRLGAAQAIPIGLIINEALTNSFKYAFPNYPKGEIKVSLKKVEDEIFLSVTDNGVGFKWQSDEERSSLGLDLIKGLTLDLHGTIDFDSSSGTRIQIRFMIDRTVVPADEEEVMSLNF